MDITERLIADYTSSVTWGLSLMQQPCLEMVKFSMKALKPLRLDPMESQAWLGNNGVTNLLFIAGLVEASSGDDALPEGINLSLLAFVGKKLEAPSHAHTSSLVPGTHWILGLFLQSRLSTSRLPEL